MTAKPPSRSGRYRTQRIINGIANNVIEENGDIVEVLGPAKRPSSPEQEQSNIKMSNGTEEKPRVGIPLIAEDGYYVDPAKQTKEMGDNTITKLNDMSQEQKPTSGMRLTPVSVEELSNIFKQDKQDNQDTQDTQDTQDKQNQIEPVKTPKFGKKPELEDIPNKIPDSDPNMPDPQESNITEPTKMPGQTEAIVQVAEPKKSHIPTIEQKKKPPQVPKVTIPKVQISIPSKSTKSERSKLGNISNKPGGTIATDTYLKTKETEVIESSLQKANENTLIQQPVTTREKSTKEKIIPMSEELEAELLDERKFEQWMKKQKFRENLEKAARFAEETKEQFEEKIPELSNKIENVTGEVKNVENRLGTVDDRLGTVDKSIGTLCTGIDCIKEDVKKYQTSHDALEKLVQEKYKASQDALEKLVQERFQDLGEKVKGLERPIFTCENCGEQVIAPLSSYCPNCGSEIQSWSDEEGHPVRGWSPYWKRSGRSTSQ